MSRATIQEVRLAGDGGTYDVDGGLEPLLQTGPRGEDEHARVGSGDMSPGRVGLNLVKCCVGAGSFGFPYALKQSGLLSGVIIAIVLGVFAAYTFCTLADAEKHCARKDGRRRTYPQVARALFPNMTIGNVNVMETIVYVGVICTVIGVAAAYCIFIVTTMPQVISIFSPSQFLLILFPMTVALALLRTFRVLAFTSILGDIAVIAGFVSTVAYGFVHHTPTVDLPQMHIKGIGPASGNLAFLFLSHIVALPMVQSLKGDFQNPRRWYKIVSVAFTIIAIGNVLFAGLCYMLFQEDTEDNVIHNLSTSGVALQVVRVLLSLDLLFTFPMILACGRELLELSIQKTNWEFVKRYPETSKDLLRVGMVVVLELVAFAIIYANEGDAFGNVVTLVGGLFNFLLGFILPPIFHIKLHGRNLGIFSLSLNVFILLLGTVLSISSTYFTIKNMA